jgi:hypothetical protein
MVVDQHTHTAIMHILNTSLLPAQIPPHQPLRRVSSGRTGRTKKADVQHNQVLGKTRSNQGRHVQTKAAAERTSSTATWSLTSTRTRPLCQVSILNTFLLAGTHTTASALRKNLCLNVFQPGSGLIGLCTRELFCQTGVGPSQSKLSAMVSKSGAPREILATVLYTSASTLLPLHR